MNHYLNELKKQIADYQAKCGIDEPFPVLDSLWQIYTEFHPVSDAQVKKAEQALEPFWEGLSFDQSETFFDVVSELVTAYQRAAFLEGIQIGVQLSVELHEK